MIKCGRTASLLLAFACCVNLAVADIDVSADRQRVALGDSLRLTVTVDGDEKLSDIKLSALNSDFEILQRSTSSNTSIINGVRTHIRQLLVDIAPRREGTLAIPALRAGSAVSRPIAIVVDRAPDPGAADQTVLFEAELDRDSVYVQGQLLLTLRLQQSVNLDSRSITELQLDDAFVKQLGQNSFQRNRDGRPWLVHEVSYAIFPEHSGELVIPAQTFTARESDGRRSMFSQSGGSRLQRRTDPITVTVLPRPATYTAPIWLPARDLRIEEQWSVPPEQLRAGESATRTVRIIGSGLQGAQLPPVLFSATDGLKYYPDQPAIEDRESSDGLTGVRQDSAALVPTRGGSWTVPEIRIPWWDTENQRLREAILPARKIQVAVADFVVAAAPPPPVTASQGEATQPLAPLPEPIIVTRQSNPLWLATAVISSLGWVLTLLWIFWDRRPGKKEPAAFGDDLSEARAYKQLLAACASDNPLQARRKLVDWCACLFPQEAVLTVEQVARLMQNTELKQQLRELDQVLYGGSQISWQGAELANLAKTLRKRARKGSYAEDATLQLYPASTGA